MSLWSAIKGGNGASGFEEAFRVKDITTSGMKSAIGIWLSLYFEAAAAPEEDDCQRLPVLTVGKLCKTVFSEYEAGVSGPKQDFLRPLLGRLDAVKQKAMQYELVGGECLLKPVPLGKSYDFMIIRRDCFLPLERDGNGKITSVGTAEQTVAGGKYYTLCERRTVRGDGSLLIESRLYCADTRGTLGTQVPLAALEKYARLQPELILPGIFNLGMVQMKTPLLNCVDGSDDGVSVYAPAVGLIRNINRNERQMDDEFDNGASRIIASSDMISMDANGKKVLSDKLFTAVDDDVDTVGVTIFSPALREASYLARKQEYLRNMEGLIGLKRGILSEVEATERTATEITSSAGDYNLTITDFQATWEAAVRELLATCDRLGQAYKLCSGAPFDPEKELVMDWGNGILYDADKTWAEYLQMVAAGMLKPEIALAWKFRLPWETPADLQKIRDRYMPELEKLAGGDE